MQKVTYLLSKPFQFFLASFFLVALINLCSCTTNSKNDETYKKFSLISSAHSGIHFSNILTQTDSINIYTFRNFYNGAGVGLGDFNNDGLLDIFLAGNQVDNALYMNLGDFVFKDITKAAGVESQNVWTTGVSIVDINGDGWLDIYVCKSGDNKGENRHNELFINNGKNTDGSGKQTITFTEQSKQYGLADLGLSTHAAFFDYDKDGDLDCYLLNNSYRTVGGYDLIPGQREKRDSAGGNKLYRNEMAQGSFRFTDVSEEAGIYGSAIGFGLGVAISDLNGDEWPDIFVSNDFFEKDYMYINNHDGTFSERIEDNTNEISMGSMGADIADLNNDSRPEIFVTEMLPRDQRRYKTKAQFEDWNKFVLNKENGYFQQFARNVLQLNLGEGVFSEISRFAGVDATDWSWGALIADYDANGYQDIFVANGIYLDLLDQDYINFFSDARQVREILHDPDKGMLGLIEKIPSEPIANCLFSNYGNLQFSEDGHEWGLDNEGFSNGAAYGDLDNDGDLDLVVNNINAPPFLLRNNSKDINFIRIKLIGENYNTQAIGSKILVYSTDRVYFRELYPQRGFMSSVDPIINIGLGSNKIIDSIEVIWPNDQNVTIERGVVVNTLIELREEKSEIRNYKYEQHLTLLKKIDGIIDFQHQELEYSDFDKEQLLIKMNSREGPACCTGDINNDGLMDFYIGGASGQKGKLYVQNQNGSFQSFEISSEDKYEETDCIFFDANGDKDIDLYVASGSSEFGNVNAALIDRIYINKGGTLEMSDQILPNFKFENSSSVDHLDFDKDGDSDLIVGINSVPFRYGLPSTSYLLENDGSGNFTTVKNEVAPALENIGMVSDVTTGDFDLDGDDDIAFAGEWMIPRFLENVDGVFLEKNIFFNNISGFWNLMEAKDIDNDGDLDFILGNMGKNNQLRVDSVHPARMYINDFDQNGKIEQILCLKEDDIYVPYHTRKEIVKQLPVLAKSIPNYEAYAGLGIDEIFPAEVLSRSILLEFNENRSGILLNLGNWRFEFIPFPEEAQLSSIHACEVLDLNEDGNLDLLLGGNQKSWNPRLGGQEGSYGVCLISKGGGHFSAISHKDSGFFEHGEIRKIKLANRKIIIAKNNMKTSLYEIN